MYKLISFSTLLLCLWSCVSTEDSANRNQGGSTPAGMMVGGNQGGFTPTTDMTIGELDLDGDGFTVSEGDCDDSNPNIYPNAPEIFGDQIDQDCDQIADVEDGVCEANFVLKVGNNRKLILDGCRSWEVALNYEYDPDNSPKINGGSIKFKATTERDFQCELTLEFSSLSCGLDHVYNIGSTLNISDCSGLDDQYEGSYHIDPNQGLIVSFTEINTGNQRGNFSGSPLFTKITGYIGTVHENGINLRNSQESFQSYLYGFFSIASVQVRTDMEQEFYCNQNESVTVYDFDGDGESSFVYGNDNQDCDDLNPTIYSSASESCNGIDDNCNGIQDDGLLNCCGDGVSNGDEQCDDGNINNIDECTNNCTLAVCGDGFIQRNEQCDDGNMTTTDECTNNCTLAVCGDGFIQSNFETCDDGNMVNTDECTNNCTLAMCGDGIIRSNFETCDDGNMVNTDECTNNCTLAVCGDGLVRRGFETCDDGNMVNTDECTNNCTLAVCGDGFIQRNEQCDDGIGTESWQSANTNLPLPRDPRDFRAMNDFDSNCWNDAGDDAFDCFGNSTLEINREILNLDVLPGMEQQATIGGVRVIYRSELIGNTWRLTIKPAIEGDESLFNFTITGNTGSDFSTEAQLNEITVNDRQIPYLRTVDDPFNPSDPPIFYLLLPSDPDQIDRVSYETYADDIIISATQVKLPITFYTVVSYLPIDSVTDILVADIDPGNMTNTGECTNNCTLAICGDGLVRRGFETCDDGNMVNTDECTNNCTLAVCGDGFIQRNEQCDDGNMVNTDECTNNCTLAVCDDQNPLANSMLLEGCRPCGANCPEIEMILIQAGSFNMGSNTYTWDQPIHNVQIRSNFYVGKTEVTVGQYRACVNAGQCTAPDGTSTSTYCNWTSSAGAKETHPVNCVDWNQARTYARWIGGDLLTEAQWEYVATGQGQAITYPWGNAAPTCQLANFYNNDFCVNPPNGSTAPVCSTTGGNTTQGVCDMGGNVWEWVLDEYHDSYSGAPANEQAWCSDIGVCNTNTSADRVLRGGDWASDAFYLPSAFRAYSSPDFRYDGLGFRVSRYIP